MIAAASDPSPESGGTARASRRGGVSSLRRKDPHPTAARLPPFRREVGQWVSIPRIRLVDEPVRVGLRQVDRRALHVGIERLEHLVGGLGGFAGEAAVG